MTTTEGKTMPKTTSKKPTAKKNAKPMGTANTPAGAVANGVSEQTVERWLAFLGLPITTTEGNDLDHRQKSV